MNESSPNKLSDKLITLITPLVQPMGYEIVYLEVDQRQKALRLFIDHADGSQTARAIGIGDCVTVTKALDEPLDQMPEIDEVFGAAGYELEVSSPGIDRPLRTARDFEKFKGHEIRIHTFRPLSGEELSNSGYQSRNPKQKNFFGDLQGMRDGRVLLAINPAGGHDPFQAKKKSKKSSPSEATNSEEGKDRDNVVTIPLPLISKANLEPDFSGVEDGA
jgi:ribosome maturation factor RimP